MSLSILLLIDIVSSSCSYGFLTFSAIRSRLNSSPVNDPIKLLDSELIIMPEMSFTCNGTMKGIYLSGRINGCCGDYPQLLIWEPAKESNTTFDLVSATPIEIVRISSHGYFYYEFETPLSFYENNVLGMYQPSGNDGFQVAYNNSVPDAPISYTCPLKSGDPVSQKIDIANTRIVRPLEDELLLISPVTSEILLSCCSHMGTIMYMVYDMAFGIFFHNKCIYYKYAVKVMTCFCLFLYLH